MPKTNRLHYAWVVAAVTFIVLLSTSSIRAVPGLMLVPLQTEFGWSPGAVSSAFGLNILLYGLFGPFSVAIMDRFGMRRVLVASLLCMGCGAALVPFLGAIWQLDVVWGLFVGLGSGATALVLAATVAGRWFTAKRGIVLGVLTASAAAGQLLLLPVLARVSQELGWRAMVFVVAGICFALVPLVIGLMRDRPADLGLAPYGEDGPPHPVQRSTGNLFLTPLRALAAGAANRDFMLLAGSYFICGATTNGLIATHLVPACVDAGISPVVGASLLAGMGVFNMIGATASGWLSDRIDNRMLLAIYFVLRGISLIYLPFSFTSLQGLSVFAVFYGLDWIATVPPTVRLCTNIFGREKGGMMYGWVSAAHQLGGATAAFLGGVARGDLGGYLEAFITAGLACMAAATMVLLIGRGRMRLPALAG